MSDAEGDKKPDFNIYEAGGEERPVFYFLNILAFLCCMCDDYSLLDKDPWYIIDKIQQYLVPNKSKSHEFLWGLHPSLFNGLFMKYCEKYNLDITDCIKDLSNADKQDSELVEWIKSIQEKKKCE